MKLRRPKTEEEKQALVQMMRCLRAEREFDVFLEFVKFPEVTPTGENTGNVISFEMWPHLKDVVNLLTKYDHGRLVHRLLVWLKARQLGASQLLAAYAVWVASYRDNSKILVISQGETYAWEFMEKARFIYDNLPPELKRKLRGKWTRGRVSFTNGSVVEAFPSTEDAGRGWTGTLVIMDEADKHPYLGANFMSVKPVIDAGAQMIMVSTSDPEKLTSPFKETFLEAPDNGWTPIFYGWNARPDRDTEFRGRVFRETPESERWRVQYEYPETIDEALAPPQEFRVFDMNVYQSMMDRDTKDPIRTMGTSTGIWQEFTPGKKYTMFTDTGKGVGKDYSVTVVLDCTTGMVVADVFSRTLDATTFAYESIALAVEYKKPLWAVECNDPSGGGLVVVQQALKVHYPRLWRDKQDTDPQHLGPHGWYTDKDNRPLIWHGLIAAFKARLVTVPHKEGLGQFNQVIRNDKGRVEARQGGNDDYPLAVAGAWYIRDWAHQAAGLWRPGQTIGMRQPIKVGF